MSAARAGPMATDGDAARRAGAPGRRALLAGGTGLVGTRVLARLLADDTWSQVHVIGRRALPGGGHRDAVAAGRLAEHVVDFGSLVRRPGLPPVDDVLVCLGTTIRAAGSQAAFRRIDFDAVVAVARVALMHRVNRR